MYHFKDENVGDDLETIINDILNHINNEPFLFVFWIREYLKVYCNDGPHDSLREETKDVNCYRLLRKRIYEMLFLVQKP